MSASPGNLNPKLKRSDSSALLAFSNHLHQPVPSETSTWLHGREALSLPFLCTHSCDFEFALKNRCVNMRVVATEAAGVTVTTNLP